MKKGTLIVVLLVVVILMVRNPKKTTAEITTGERALTQVGQAGATGFFGK